MIAAQAAQEAVARVLVCDDSATVRRMISRILEADPGIRVVARTGDGQAALDAVARHDIDVVVLDIEMPIMDGMSAPPLLLAAHLDWPLTAGEILLAPGDFHLLVRRHGGDLRAHLSRSPRKNFCRPSVDPMLRSAAEAAEGRVLAVILTGMGSGGVEGTRSLVARGGAALVQDEATSVVWGMPGAVARAGLAHAVLPLNDICPRILSMVAGLP